MKLFNWLDYRNNVATNTSDKETYNSSRVIGDLKKPKPNYSKGKIEARLLQANDKVKRNVIDLTPRQTIVVMCITAGLDKAEMEY